MMVSSIVAGCDFREIDYSFYDLSQVSIQIKSDEIEDLKDMNYEVVFFDASDTITIQHYFYGDSTTVFLPSGKYDLLLHNCLSQNNYFDGDSFADYCCFSELSIYNDFNITKSDKQSIFKSPGSLFSGVLTDVDIIKNNSKGINEIDIEIEKRVSQYSFFIPVKGIEYLTSISGIVTGMASSFNIKENSAQGPPCSILLDIIYGVYNGMDGIWCSFNTFGIMEGEEHWLYLFELKKPDGTVQSFEYNISEFLSNGEKLIPETIVIDYAAGQSGFTDPAIGVWRDDSQWIELK